MLDQNSVALVALIVSLVALFIALLQLLQTSFGTADGGRHTNAAIMGNWASMTKWRWNWIEFRFIVKYTAPHIAIGSSEDLNKDEFYDNDNVHTRSGGDRWRLEKLHVLGRHTLPDNIEVQWNADIDKFSERRRSQSIVDRVRNPLNTLARLNKREFDNEVMVSWDRLLQAAYSHELLVVRYYKDSSAHGTSPPSVEQKEADSSSSDPEGHLAVVKSTKSVSASTGVMKPIEGNSFVCVQLKRRSWDYVLYVADVGNLTPPDVTRPLASIGLGDLVILAQRLGMKWQEIRLKDGYVRAGGNGYTISSTNIRNFGLVIQFSVESEQVAKRPPQEKFTRTARTRTVDDILIPSSAIDKMLLGIVPGDPDLVGDEFPCNDETGRPRPNLMFDKLSTDEKVQNLAQSDFRTRMLVNDAIALLCPFLPLKGLPAVRIIHPVAWPKGWEAGYLMSLFHYWESRGTMRLRAQKAAKEKDNEVIQQVSQFLEEIADKYPDDYYCRWYGDYRSYIHPAGGRVTKAENDQQVRRALTERMEMVNRLKEIFDHTQNFFLVRNQVFEYQEALTDKRFTGKTKPAPIKYTELVRAYLNVQARVIHNESGRLPEELISPYRTMTEEMLAGDLRGPAVDPPVLWQANAMVSALPLLHEEYKPNETGKTRHVTETEIEEAGWMLLLRGICWNMSIWMEECDINALVPSSLYYNGSLVWIT